MSSIYFLNFFSLLFCVTFRTSASNSSFCPENCLEFGDNIDCTGEHYKTVDITGDFNCHCDPTCLVLNDCCDDFKSVCGSEFNATLNDIDYSSLLPGSLKVHENESNTDLEGRLLCNNIDGQLVNRFYVINSCPDGEAGHRWSHPKLGSFPSELCSGYNSSRRFGNPTSTIPVVHFPSGITFGNLFCAICNGIPLREVRLWDSVYYCNANISVPNNVRRKVAAEVSEFWDSLSYLCTLLPKVDIEQGGVYVRKCFSDFEHEQSTNSQSGSNGDVVTEITDKNSCGSTYGFFWMAPDSLAWEELEYSHLHDIHTNVSEDLANLRRYEIRFRDNEIMEIEDGRTKKVFELDVCKMLPVDDLCWPITKVPTCVELLSSQTFFSLDFDVRVKPEGCVFTTNGQKITLLVVYATGRGLSLLLFTVLVILKRSAMDEKKTSNFEKNAIIVLMFLWFKSILHCGKFLGICGALAPFIHFCQDSAFLWLFVMGYDLQIERRDLMPPFLYMMSSWVFPLIIAIVGAIMLYARVGLYWLYNSTNLCWYTPLYWEIPEMSFPLICNLYTMAITCMKMFGGHSDYKHHQLKYLVLFPVLLFDYFFTFFAAYINSEWYFVVALMTQSYLGVVIVVVYFFLSINDALLEPM